MDAACDGSFAVSGSLYQALELAGPDGVVSLADTGNTFFIARFAASGDALWARPIEIGIGSPLLRLAQDGSVIVAGTYSAGATFGVGENNETELPGWNDAAVNLVAYVARYDADGRFLWVKSFERGNMGLLHFAAGPEQTTYAYVSSGIAVTLGEGEIDFELGAMEKALVVLGADGSLLRAVRLSSGFQTDGFGLEVLAAGDVAIGGVFEAGATLASGTPQAVELPTSDRSAFLATFSPELDLTSTRVFPGDQVVPLSDGGFLTTARFTTSVTLGAGASAATFEPRPDSSNHYLAYYDADGQLLWAAQIAGSAVIRVEAFEGFADGSAWLVVSNNNAAATYELAPDTAQALSVAADANSDLVIRFDQQGHPVWVETITSSGGPIFFSALGASPTSLIVSSSFTGTLSFGSSTLELQEPQAVADNILGEVPFLALFNP
jgi:hypothetical protein